MEQVILAINGDPADTVQAGNECISAGFMGTDFLSLGKRKLGNAYGIILSQCFTDNLPFLIGYLLL